MFITGFVMGFFVFALNPAPAHSQEIRKPAGTGKVTHLGTYRYAEKKFVPQVKSKQQQETIFDNTNQTGGFLPPNQVGKTPPVEFLDWGQSNGGTIDGFQIGYATSSAGPISLKMKFYHGTDDAGDGAEIASFDLTGLPGSTSGAIEIFTYDVDISSTPFDLPPGNFGYGYVMNDSLTGPLTAGGGTGITDSYRLPPSLTNLQIIGFFAQFYLKLTGARVLQPIIFVNNALSNGDGSFLNPFNNLTSAALAAGIGYTIFVHAGNALYDGGFAMKAGQKLIGNGVDLVSGGQVIVPAGERPVITNSTGNGVDLANDVYIAGLDIVDPKGSGIHGAGVGGSNTFGDISLSGGSNGIDISGSDGTYRFGTLKITNPIDSSMTAIRFVDDPNAVIHFDSLYINIYIDTRPAPIPQVFISVLGEINIETGVLTLNGGGIFMVDVDIEMEFESLALLDSPDDGLSFMDVTGNFTVHELTTISGSGSHGINMTNIDSAAFNFGNTTITNVDSSGVRIRKSSGNVTFKRLDIDGARVGVQIDSLDGTFEITGDGTPGSGGTIQNTTESVICADNVVQVEIVELSLVSVAPITITFLQTESSSDVDLDLCIPSEPAGSIDITLDTKDEAADSSNSNANSLAKNSGSQTLVILANSSLAGAGGVNIKVGGTASANIELIGNTITTTADSGITVQTGDASTALVTLSNNDVSSVANDFVLVQESGSTFQLAGFAGGDAAAVAAFIQDNNAGTPSVAISGSISADPTVSVEEMDPTLVPTEFSLAQNYPNPFNPSTTIQFALPRQSEVTLNIFSLNGQLVRTLAAGNFAAGSHKVIWDGRDDMERQVTSGLYISQLTADAFVKQVKMLLIK